MLTIFGPSGQNSAIHSLQRGDFPRRQHNAVEAAPRLYGRKRDAARAVHPAFALRLELNEHIPERYTCGGQRVCLQAGVHLPRRSCALEVDPKRRAVRLFGLQTRLRFSVPDQLPAQPAIKASRSSTPDFTWSRSQRRSLSFIRFSAASFE